jgi:hypothetical protein
MRNAPKIENVPTFGLVELTFPRNLYKLEKIRRRLYASGFRWSAATRRYIFVYGRPEHAAKALEAGNKLIEIFNTIE